MDPDSKFIAAQIQMPIPNKCSGFAYKGLVFCKSNGDRNFGKHGQGTHSTLMGDSLAQNTSKNFSPKYLPKPKSSRFLKKSLSGCPQYVI